MNRIIITLSITGGFLLLLTFYGCQQGCVNNILLQTTAMDISVNSDNLGVSSADTKNNTDTIRSSSRQFYNYPGFRQFGMRIDPARTTFISSAYASGDCPDQLEYISRMDPEKTMLSLNVEYDASQHGLGILPADTNLLSIEILKDSYFTMLLEDPFLNAGGPAPVTIEKDFFEPINNQWVTFQFSFEEQDGTVFEDSVRARIDMIF